LDASIQSLDAVNKPFTEENKSSASSSSLFKTFTQKNQAHFIENKSELKHWKDVYEPSRKTADRLPTIDHRNAEVYRDVENADNFTLLTTGLSAFNIEHSTLLQLHNTYIVLQNDVGFLLIHQQNAHERVLYERFTTAVAGKPIATQQSLFPVTIELTPVDVLVLNELLPDLHFLGYQIEAFGKNTFVIQGTPADLEAGNEKITIEKMLEQYKHFSNDLKYSKREKLLRSLAWQQAVKAGTSLSQSEMKTLLENLFACATPNITPNGKPVYTEFKKNELDKMFGR
jgi:DNA mismatch repair protein MutL